MADATARLPDRVIAYTGDPNIADGLARLADGCGIAMAEVLPGGMRAALADDAPKGDAILLDFDDPDEGVEAVSVLNARGAKHLVAVGRVNDIQLYRRLRDAGAADYLVTPFDDGDLLNALKLPPVRTGRESQDSDTQGPHVTVVLGCRGGVGATGLAVSLAWWTAEKLQTQTGLVDLDLCFGTATLALDLLPGRGLREALEFPERIDPLFVGSAMINATDNLFVLGAEEALGMDFAPAPDGLTRLIEAVSGSVPTVVVDLPRGLLPVAGDMLKEASEIVLVTDLSLGGLRDAIRMRQFCRNTAPDVMVTLTAMSPVSGAPAVERSEFERAYEGSIDWLLPPEPKLAAEAAAKGKPVVSLLKARHGYSQAVTDIAQRAVSGEEAAAKKGRRKWLW